MFKLNLLQTILFFILICLTFPLSVKSYDGHSEKIKLSEINRDKELSVLLVKLEKRTRTVMADHYNASQYSADATKTYKKYMISNGILPAAIADPIFYETVRTTTKNRAWVKMVVANPRNPNNKGDSVALEMLEELRKGYDSSQRDTMEAFYYGEPIVATAGCMECHGDPAGEADPHFPKFKKDGWKEKEVIGGVISRVAKSK